MAETFNNTAATVTNGHYWPDFIGYFSVTRFLPLLQQAENAAKCLILRAQFNL